MREIHLRDARRYRNDAAKHRQKAADEYGKGSPALEEPMHDQQAIVREVDVLTVAFDDRNASKTADRVTRRISGQLARQRNGNRKPDVAQMAGRGEAAGDGEDDLRPDRHPDIPEYQGDEQAEIAVRIDERDDRLLEVFHR